MLSDAKHGDHTHFELITTTVTTADGLEGVGYTYTGGKGGRAIKALIEDDLTPAILDQDSACIEKVGIFGRSRLTQKFCNIKKNLLLPCLAPVLIRDLFARRCGTTCNGAFTTSDVVALHHSLSQRWTLPCGILSANVLGFRCGSLREGHQGVCGVTVVGSTCT